MECENCTTTKNVKSYNYNENGYPTLENGTDVSLCKACWETEMGTPN